MLKESIPIDYASRVVITFHNREATLSLNKELRSKSDTQYNANKISRFEANYAQLIGTKNFLVAWNSIHLSLLFVMHLSISVVNFDPR